MNRRDLTGIGEGSSLDMMQQCASMLIGEDPARIDPLWRLMFRGSFYPLGREKQHALGALDVALWDIKGKALASRFTIYSVDWRASILKVIRAANDKLVNQRLFDKQ